MPLIYRFVTGPLPLFFVDRGDSQQPGRERRPNSRRAFTVGHFRKRPRALRQAIFRILGVGGGGGRPRGVAVLILAHGLSFHPSLFIQDEAAHIPEGEESLNAVIPSMARIISISTAAPGWFGDSCGL